MPHTIKIKFTTSTLVFTLLKAKAIYKKVYFYTPFSEGVLLCIHPIHAHTGGIGS